KVFLVGAGPGDPDLLTIKAVKAIAAADVVLLDDLVNRGVLQHARPDVRIVEVGKRGGCQSTPQEFIERLLVAEARAGQCVVRLKGGDPFIFGRGGEECATLRAAGIEVEVVNGISSGLAAPSATGAGQAQLITTLGALPQALAASGLGSPSIIVIGDVVRCAAGAGANAALPEAIAA